MGDNFFEYAGVPRPRFELWHDLLRDVGFARDDGPPHGRPGYEEHQKLSRQAVEQLWPHLDLLSRLVKDDLSHIHRSIADARAKIAWRIKRSYLLPEEYAQVPPGPPVVERLRAALKTFAERGDVYMGWIAWYGYE